MFLFVLTAQLTCSRNSITSQHQQLLFPCCVHNNSTSKCSKQFQSPLCNIKLAHPRRTATPQQRRRPQEVVSACCRRHNCSSGGTSCCDQHCASLCCCQSVAILAALTATTGNLRCKTKLTKLHENSPASSKQKHRPPQGP